MIRIKNISLEIQVACHATQGQSVSLWKTKVEKVVVGIVAGKILRDTLIFDDQTN